jgi:hypothetical protein
MIRFKSALNQIGPCVFKLEHCSRKQASLRDERRTHELAHADSEAKCRGGHDAARRSEFNF